MTNDKIRSALAIGIGKVLGANALPVTLYDYQRETLESAMRWLVRPGAPSRAYVAQATGLGKTIEEAALVAACEGLRVLVIVPTKIMVTQFVRDLAGYTEGKMAHASSLKDIADRTGTVIASHWKGVRHDVLVTTDETFKAKTALIKSELDPHVIIWDECHWSYTPKAQAALAAFPEAIVIAFSATPDYLTTTAKRDSVPVTLDNGQVLYGAPDKFARAYYPELLDERTARWGIQHKRLAPLAWGELDFTLELDDVPVVDGPGGMDYDQAALQNVMRTNWPFVVTAVRKLYESGQYQLATRFSAAVCPGVHEAETLAEELRGIGLAAEVISQKTKDAERDAILGRGARGELQFLSSVFVLREGWNAPNAEVAMMLRPTKSRVLYVQFMGRPLRLFGDKVALVLDPHYQNTRFAPLSAPVLFGTPGQVVRGGDILVGGTGAISPYLLDNLRPILTVKPLEIEYWAGEDGTFEAGGEVWGTVSAFVKILELSPTAIKVRLISCRMRYGKTAEGLPCDFYALSDVRKACADLLDVKDQAGKDGTFKADGEVWGMVASAAMILHLSEGGVASRISSSCRQRQGRDNVGRVATFYALSDVRKACADLLDVKDQAGKDGTFKADGEVWRVLSETARHLGLSERAVQSRIASCGKRIVNDRTGTPQIFNALSNVRKACADLLDVKDQAGKDGTFKADGKVWSTLDMPSIDTGLNKPMLRKHIGSCAQRQGRDRGGRVRTFYSVSDVRFACKDVKPGKKKKK